MMTTNEAAKLLGIKGQSARWLVQKGRIASRKATPEETAELLKSGRIKGVPPMGITLIEASEIQRYLQERLPAHGLAKNRRATEKRCGVCKEWKSLTEFGRNRSESDGLQTRCKTCRAEAARTHTKERRLAGALPTRHEPTNEPKQCNKCGEVKTATAFGVNRSASDGRNATCRECRRKASGPSLPLARMLHRQRYPDKAKARGAVNDAVRRGKLPKAKSLLCSQCGNPALHYHHHNGYDKAHQLDVVPLCLDCHTLADLD